MLYWYKSTNTDAAHPHLGGVRSIVRAMFRNQQDDEVLMAAKAALKDLSCNQYNNEKIAALEKTFGFLDGTFKVLCEHNKLRSTCRDCIFNAATQIAAVGQAHLREVGPGAVIAQENREKNAMLESLELEKEKAEELEKAKAEVAELEMAKAEQKEREQERERRARRHMESLQRNPQL